MVSVDLLGPVRVSAVAPGGGALRPAARALLARLALARGRLVSVDQLISDLWDDDGPVNPTSALRVIVSRARKALGEGPALLFEQGGYRLTGVECDADRFEALVVEARAALAGGHAAAGSAMLTEALALWRGEPLLDVRWAPFAVAHAVRLEAERLTATEQRVAADLDCGRHAELLAELAALVVEHPLQERLWAQRMLALYRSGRQADALRAYTELRELLADNLGLEPDPTLRALEQAILVQSPELDLPDAALGARGDSDTAPALISAPLSSLIGRRRELDVVIADLGGSRLVSLVGPAGVGKTRLAVEIAVVSQRPELDERRSVWFVELGGRRDGASLVDVIGAGLGVSATERHRTDAAITRITGRGGLLVLDNCEPGPSGAGEGGRVAPGCLLRSDRPGDQPCPAGHRR